MKKKLQNRIEELAERSSFRLNSAHAVPKEENNLNAFRSSDNKKTLKGSREKEPAIE